MTFNQVVRGSNPRTLIDQVNRKCPHYGGAFRFSLYIEIKYKIKVKFCMEHLYDKLKAYSISGHYGFHMPGHKRNTSLLGTELPYGLDITEIDGFDDLHHARGIIRERQECAAKLYHADESHYLVNGSTVGLLSAILGSTRPGDRVIVARNCHKSVYNAIFLNDLKPVYIYPDMVPGTDICGPVSADQVAALTREYPDAKAVIITSPTYDGIVSDVAAIAEEAHRNGIPLILDEAHGAHFGFHPYFPKNGNQLGADLVIHSLHKTMPSLTQTALLHMNGELADRDNVRRYLHMLQSSSPSYILMASIDQCIRLISEKKNELFECYVNLLEETRSKLGTLKHLSLFETADYDRGKILIRTDGTGIETEKEIKRYTGKFLSEQLREKYAIQLEMALINYAVAMTSVCDTESGMERLVCALYEIDGKLAKYKNNDAELAKTGKNECFHGNNIYELSIRETNIFANTKINVSYADAEGTIAAEFAYVYPPGIPLAVPGERISRQTAEALQNYADSGFDIEGTRIKGKIEVLKNG